MKQACVDYSTFWTLVVAKGLLPQYTEDVDGYILFAIEGNISWESNFRKDGSESQIDFEANRKASCNQPLEFRSTEGLLKIASSMFTDDLSYWVDGSNGILNVTAGETGCVRTNFPVPFKLNGVDMHWTNANIGDYVNFDVGVYNNNDISSETNFIQLSQFANKYRVNNEASKTFTVDTVKTIPSTYNGLTIYIRTTYVNTGSNNSTLLVNILGYK